MVMTRDEVFRASGPTSGTNIRMKIGAKRDGTIVAANASLWYEAGAYRGSPSGAGAMCCLAPYTIPNFLIEAYDVVVNKPKVAAYRAPDRRWRRSRPSRWSTRSRARSRSIRSTLRLKNAVAEGDHAPYGPKYGPIGLKQVLEAARAHPHWNAPLGPNQGRGVACGFWFNAGMNSSATVTLNADGSAAVVTGNPDIGGTRVAQALMVAEELGIPVERVRPSVADTDTAGYTDVTGGSRVCYATGMAVIRAAQDVARAAARARREDLERRSRVGSPGSRAAPCRSTEPRPAAAHRSSSSPRRWRRPAVRSSAAPRSTRRWPVPGFAAHICDLEVDPETGAARSCATPRFRTWARPCIRASSKDRCRAARRRASAGR